jgi:hypothetical protein
MSGFGSSATTTKRAASDPTKHVNYVLGMVLGVDDFTQEFAYLSERDRWLARDLLGYGTAWGLAVTTALGSRGPEVRVSPGVALSPRGQLVRVSTTQCASLNDWLKSQGSALVSHDATQPVRAYVVLCYRECLTDPVPVPGEPCRSEDDAMAPSRVTDDFKLELRLQPPEEPTEEQAVRDLVRWLRMHVQPVHSVDEAVSEDQFLKLLRDAVVPPASEGPDTDWFSDTSPADPIKVHVDNLERFLRAALRVWVTELRALWRPNWLGEAQGCHQPVSAEPISNVDCLPLGALELPVVKELGSGDWKVQDGAAILIGEEPRPYLLHLRLLQEWALAGPLHDPSAVHHPAGLTAYSVVAAGALPIMTSGDSGVTGYNNLRIEAVDKGYALLTFDGYDYQPERWQYVVKLTLQEEDAGLTLPTLTILRMDGDGIHLRIRERDDHVGTDQLSQMFVIAEVSQYILPPNMALRAGRPRPPAPAPAPAPARPSPRRRGGGR